MSKACVHYSSIYEGIDIKTYSKEGNYKYDYIIHPNANTNDIQFYYDGVSNIKITDGNLILKTSIGEINEHKPYSYQIIDNEVVEVECNYSLSGNTISFVVENYNKNYILIIDPIVTAATLTGSITENMGHCATYDSEGNIFAAGRSLGSQFYTTLGAFQTTSGGVRDIAISKYTSDATQLIFSTYMGGSSEDVPSSMIVNSNDELFLYGSTESDNFPLSTNAFDQLYEDTEIIVAHFTEDGSGIIGSTYVGGSDQDGYNWWGMSFGSQAQSSYGGEYRGEIILDQNENPVIASFTHSANFPVTSGAFQTTYNQYGEQDGVLFRMNEDLSQMISATYIADNYNDALFSLRVASDNTIYATGYSTHANFPTTSGVYQEESNSGKEVIIVHLNEDMTQMLHATYFGTIYKETGYFIDLDDQDNVYIFGTCSKGGMPITSNIYNNGGSTQFVSKFTPDLSTLTWSTMIGTGNINWMSTGEEYDLTPIAFMVDECGFIYMAGFAGFSTYSGSPSNMPLTTDAFQNTGGIWLGLLTPDATDLGFGSYYGNGSGLNDHTDGGVSRFDKSGIMYLAVCTTQGFQATSGAWESNYPSQTVTSETPFDIGAIKIDFEHNPVYSEFNLEYNDTACVPVTVTFENSSNGVSYIWDFGDNSPISTEDSPVHVYNNPGHYTVSLIAEDPITCNITDTTYMDVIIAPCGEIFANDTTICSGDSAWVYVTLIDDLLPAVSSTEWSNDLPTGVGSHGVLPNITTNYIVTVIDSAGNEYIDTATVTVIPTPIVDLGNDTSFCHTTEEYNLDAGSCNECIYLWQDESDNQILTATITNTYSVIVTNSIGCLASDSVIVCFGEFDTDISGTNITCHGYSDGEIELVLTTGTSPFTYAWSNSETTEDQQNISAGEYSVTVTDSLGCESFNSIIITEPDEITIELSGGNPSCYGGADGSITALASGGVSTSSGEYNYIWSENANNQEGQTISELSADIYTVTVSDSSLCTVTGDITINEPDAIAISLSPTHLLCFGDSNGHINLNISGGTPSYTFIWSNGLVSQNIAGLSEDLYYVTITDANSCTDVDQVEITGIGNPLEASITNTNLECYDNENGTIDIITSSGGTMPHSYIWSNGSTSTSLNSLSAGNYIVTIYDANSCTLINAVEITEPDELVVSLPSDFFLCGNENATLHTATTGGMFPYSYLWNSGETDESFLVSTAAVYSITVTDNNGCTDTEEIEIHEYSPIILQVSLDNDTVCPGDPITLSASISGGNGGPYYVYLDDESIILPEVIYAYENDQYLITVSDDCSNTATAIAPLALYPAPNIAFYSDITEGCAPLTVQFNEFVNSDDVGITSYLWQFSEYYYDVTSFENNPQITFPETGLYDVSLQVVTTDGCIISNTTEEMINVYPLPDADFTSNPQITGFLEPEIDFTNHSENAWYYLWYFGDGDSASAVNPHHKYSSPSEFEVTLVAYSEHGCTDTIKDIVIIHPEFTFYAPSAFTPESDGVNDYFRVFGNGIDNRNFILLVYDRWGELIFESKDINHGWDGRAKNNRKIVQSGTFTWLCIYKDINGIEHEESGAITVIR